MLTSNDVNHINENDFQKYQELQFENDRISYIDAIQAALQVSARQLVSEMNKTTPDPQKMEEIDQIITTLRGDLQIATNPDIPWKDIAISDKVTQLKSPNTPQMTSQEKEKYDFYKSKGLSDEQIQDIANLNTLIKEKEQQQEVAQKKYLVYQRPEDKEEFDKISAELKVFREDLHKLQDPAWTYRKDSVSATGIVFESYEQKAKEPQKPIQNKKKLSSSTEELIAELEGSNPRLAELILDMKAEINRLTEAKEHPIRNTFRSAVSSVKNAVNTCDEIIKEFKKEREELRATSEKKFGNLRSTSSDEQTNINNVKDIYDFCEKDILKAIESIEHIKKQLETDVEETASEMKKVTVVDKAAALLNNLIDKVNLRRANAIDKKADKHRKHARHFGNLKSAILEADKFKYKYKMRVKNAVHAIKGESFETPHYERKGLIKKLTDSLEETCRKEQKEALRYQQRADAIKTFVQKEEDYQKEKESEEKTSTLGPIKM